MTMNLKFHSKNQTVYETIRQAIIFGVTVTELHASFIGEIFDILTSMEVITSQRACILMKDDQIDEIDQIIQQMESNLNDPISWSEQDKHLHLQICEYSDAMFVKGIMQNVLAHWDRLRRYYISKRIVDAHEGHQRMLQAFRDRDTKKMAQVIWQHNRASLKIYVQYLKDKNLLEPDQPTLLERFMQIEPRVEHSFYMEPSNGEEYNK